MRLFSLLFFSFLFPALYSHAVRYSLQEIAEMLKSRGRERARAEFQKKKEIGIQNTLVSYTNGTSKLLPLFSSVARASNLYYISPS